MDAQSARRLTDAELSHELTEVRITLESIRPYHDSALEARRRVLWAEYERRQQEQQRNTNPTLA